MARTEQFGPLVLSIDPAESYASRDLVLDADLFLENHADILKQRKRIKQKTIEHQRLLHRKIAA